MKRILLLLAFTAGLLTEAAAQDGGIVFENGKSWKQVVRTARKQGRLVFLDCYTSWCGPCKRLAKNVFTRTEVAAFFNASFVNAKFDMEKTADGPALKKKFGVKAFPTMVFVDPETEEVVHKLVGAGDGDWLLKGAARALDEENSCRALVRRYKAGERGAAFMGSYLEAMSDAYDEAEVERASNAYFSSLSDEELAKAENWELLDRYAGDLLSEPLKRVAAHPEIFEKELGKEVVEDRFSRSIQALISGIAAANRYGRTASDAERTAAETAFLMQLDHADAPAALAHIRTSAFLAGKDYKGMLAKMKEVMQYNLFRNGAERIYLLSYMDLLAYSEDKEVYAGCVEWLDALVAGTGDNAYKSSLLRMKSRFLKRLGDGKSAAEASRMSQKLAGK